MTTKQHQILAIERGVKSIAEKALNGAIQTFKKDDLFNGFVRTYQPLDEENGERFPTEQTRVKIKTEDILDSVRTTRTRLINVTATKDATNTVAKANVVVDGETLLENVPATHLLFLDKQLIELQALFAELPTLDNSVTWTYDSNRGTYVTDAIQTNKGKKVAKPVVLYEATKEHPAQVKLVDEDIVVGRWTNVKFSNAIPVDLKQRYLVKLEKLREAVKFAIELANSTDVVDRATGEQIFDYLFDN